MPYPCRYGDLRPTLYTTFGVAIVYIPFAVGSVANAISTFANYAVSFITLFRSGQQRSAWRSRMTESPSSSITIIVMHICISITGGHCVPIPFAVGSVANAISTFANYAVSLPPLLVIVSGGTIIIIIIIIIIVVVVVMTIIVIVMSWATD
jgi:hypothetical protein